MMFEIGISRLNNRSSVVVTVTLLRFLPAAARHAIDPRVSDMTTRGRDTLALCVFVPIRWDLVNMRVIPNRRTPNARQ